MILSDGLQTFRVTTQFGAQYEDGTRWTNVQVEVRPGVWLGRAARCSPRDHFVKETGRRIALGRALRDAGFPKAQRAALWHSYFVVRCNGRSDTSNVPHNDPHANCSYNAQTQAHE